MNERQKRLIEVYEHLRRYFGIHTKTGFAEALHYGRTSLSAAISASMMSPCKGIMSPAMAAAFLMPGETSHSQATTNGSRMMQ